jgi:hypothetical protein
LNRAAPRPMSTLHPNGVGFGAHILEAVALA